METKSFARFLARLPSLTQHQRERLRHALDEEESPADAISLVNRRAQALHACPYCSGSHLQLWGHAAGIQRYKCCACHRCFNALSGTPLARLKRRDAWLAFAQAMVNGSSVRAAAIEAGVAPSTAFRWRHRMLSEPALQEGYELRSIVEADETGFPESFKGQRSLPRRARHRGDRPTRRGRPAERLPVLVVEDREGHHFDALLSPATPSTMASLLAQILAPETLLCCAEPDLLGAIAGEDEIACAALAPAATATSDQNERPPATLPMLPPSRQRVLHTRHVRAYSTELQHWMRRFRGVASRYLPNYLGWRRLLTRQPGAISPSQLLRHALG